MDSMLINVLLMFALTVAAIHDAKYRKIPNIITYSVIIVALACHAWQSGFGGFLFSLQGTLLGMALLILFYLTGKMGAGDVKLMGAVGSVLGPAGVFKAFLFAAIVGGIYAIIILMTRGHVLDTIRRMWLSLKLTVLTHRPIAPDEGSASPVLCYGIAIAIGTSLSMVF